MTTLSVFQTLGILGAALRFETPEGGKAAAKILDGQFDVELLEAMRYKANSMKISPPPADSELKREVELLKCDLALRIEGKLSVLSRAEQDAAEHREQQFRALLNKEFKAAQKPHAQGTVSEIAARFNISKSEVRRLKQEGKLDEFLAKSQPEEPLQFGHNDWSWPASVSETEQT